MTTKQLHVDGMTCGGCEQSVTNALLRIDGVTAVAADHASGVVKVDGENLSDEALRAAVEDAGYAVRA